MGKRPIGVFDSGLGGLTVLKQIKKELPSENIIYFGDVARVPYGPKSEIEVLKYTQQAMNFFIKHDVKAVVIACNTATAAALHKIKNEYNIPIIGVIESGVRSAIETTKNKKIGVIATEGTVKSEKYVKKIKEFDDCIEVYQKACPLFVYLVENGEMDTVKSSEIARYYLEMYKQKEIDTLVLGCTHYLHLKKDIEAVLGEGVFLVDPAERVSLDLKNILKENKIENNNTKIGKCNYYVSKSSKSFEETASKFMEEKIEELSIIDIESY